MIYHVLRYFSISLDYISSVKNLPKCMYSTNTFYFKMIVSTIIHD